MVGLTGGYTPAKEVSHRCPVCGRSYVPARESIPIPGTGPLLLVLEGVCIKAGDGWARAYAHQGDDEP